MKIEWIKATQPPEQDGWFFVVVKGYWKRRIRVDCYCVDDMLWSEEWRDENLTVTHYAPLPDMPEEEE